ncbi:MAG: methionyl-tRNA formyltransferase [Bacteroidales bacterium]
MAKDLRIIYMGTPEFAVEPLRVLIKNNKNVVAVITAPDKPAGRGKKLQSSAIKNFATENNLPVLQPTNLKDDSFIEELKAYKADLQIVVAFRMLPEKVWDMPKLGTFNLHASLLPQYRGAAPINWAVINGEKETGVTTFFLQHEIDTGDIILQKKVSIENDDNAGSVHDKLMVLGGKTVLETVNLVENKKHQSFAQDTIINEQNMNLKPAPKIFKNDCLINWDESTYTVHNKIRGLSPYPAAYTRIKDKNNKEIILKIFKTEVCDEVEKHPNGTIITDGKTFIKTVTNNGILNILEVQLAGKKRMSTRNFLLGNPLENLSKMY